MLKYLFIILIISIPFNSYSQLIDESNDVKVIYNNDVKEIYIKDKCLDILSANIEKDKNTYKFILELNDNIPSINNENQVVLEWDLMIDVDQNYKTFSWCSWAELINDIGVDYLIRIYL